MGLCFDQVQFPIANVDVAYVDVANVDVAYVAC